MDSLMTFNPRTRLAARIAILSVLLGAVGSAQTTAATPMGGPELLNTWRVQPGDDPRWAAADFDDSSWKTIPADKQWDELGIGNWRGYLWFRTRVGIPDKVGRLGLMLNLIGPNEIFANGNRIGRRGDFPPRGLLYTECSKVYYFEPGTAHSVVLAIRVWLWPVLNRIGRLPGAAYVGPSDVIRKAHELELREVLDGRIPSLMLQVLYLVLTCGLVVLFFLQRQQVEYLWLSLAILGAVVGGALDTYELLEGVSAGWAGHVDSALSIMSAICLLEFIFRFLHESVPKWVRIYQIVLALSIVRTYAALHGWISLTDSNVLHLLLYIPYWFATPLIVLWRYFRGNKEAGLLAIPIFLMFAIEMSDNIHWILWRLRLRYTVTPFFPDLDLGLVSVDPSSITHFLFFLSIGAVILYRFQKIRSDQVRAKAELEAARSMQEVMVPSSVGAPGFVIESAYRPAQEVGGDFFQVMPGEDGSVLIVIGDVSGKGLKAAMLVSLIVGLIQRSVKDTRDPAKVLSDVNDLLSGEIQDRFATCCCAVMYPDGRMALANAGHLAPYCGGVEIQTPGSMPLGVTRGIEYERIEFHVPRGQRVLFLSDGVVEARNQSGELYGFERTRVISVQPADQIAQAAQDFGQEDDITVLAIQPALG